MKDFLLEAMALKALPRTGWLRAGIPHPESVAAHSWGVSLLALALCPPTLDKEKLMAMAILHDLPEVRVGDITPHDGIPRTVKHAAEQKAAVDILPPKLFQIWQEALLGKSAEAKFLHQLDKLDMALQAITYSSQVNTEEFLESAKSKLTGDLLRLFHKLVEN